jgi:hypothetical protein
MKSRLKSLFVAAVLGVMLFAPSATTHADQNPYWRNHWGWYDNTYRPYYNSYYSPRYNSGYYGPGYYGNYGAPGYNGYYAPGGYYYGTPGVGVQVGRLNFGWW